MKNNPKCVSKYAIFFTNSFLFANMDFNWAIYNYIVLLSREYKSNRLFADSHDINERTFRVIESAWKKEEDYQISLPTIYKICQARNMTIVEFFIEVERNKNVIPKIK
tara:strand:+ start:651 stop:974 length:324 start_codon:yes stop_codon:yes gene_type:complete